MTETNKKKDWSENTYEKKIRPGDEILTLYGKNELDELYVPVKYLSGDTTKWFSGHVQFSGFNRSILLKHSEHKGKVRSHFLCYRNAEISGEEVSIPTVIIAKKK